MTERKRLEEQEQNAAFQAGVAEMSASILHNIGNTLTGATSQILKLGGFSKGLDIVGRGLQQGEERMQKLLERGASSSSEELLREVEWSGKVFHSTAKVVASLTGESGLKQVESKLGKNISHISEIISLQQSATRGGVHVTQFALKSAVLDAIEMIRDSLERYHITVELDLDQRLQHVKLPRNPLIQMLLNFIKNSMESIQQRLRDEPGFKGRIEVVVRLQEGDRFQLSIEDNGGGIEAEILESLFHFGFTTKATGSGFGLHASANFVNSLGGELKAHSAGLNQGAQMVVLLPLESDR